MSPVPTMVPLRTALAMVGAAVGVFFAGAYAAHAWEGRAGVEARSFLTVAGTLTGVPTSPTPALRFVFHKGPTDCVSDATAVSFSGSAFSAQVPYDTCGRGYFDGANVTVDAQVNGITVATAQPVNPAPYAHFASLAGQATGALNTRLAALEGLSRRRTGTSAATSYELVIPQEDLGGDVRTVNLSVIATGTDAVLRMSCTVMTGGSNGAQVVCTSLGSYNLGSLRVSATRPSSVFSLDRNLLGVTIVFSSMPVSPPWTYTIDVTALDGRPLN